MSEPTEQDIEKAIDILTSQAWDLLDINGKIKKIASALAAEREELEKEFNKVSQVCLNFQCDISTLKEELRREREKAKTLVAALEDYASGCDESWIAKEALESYQKDASEQGEGKNG